MARAVPHVDEARLMVRIRLEPRKILDVDVRDNRCPSLTCFWLSRHIVRSAAGYSGASSRTTDEWECGYRDQRGCPREAVVKQPPAYRRQRGVWLPR